MVKALHGISAVTHILYYAAYVCIIQCTGFAYAAAADAVDVALDTRFSKTHP